MKSVNTLQEGRFPQSRIVVLVSAKSWARDTTFKNSSVIQDDHPRHKMYLYLGCKKIFTNNIETHNEINFTVHININALTFIQKYSLLLYKLNFRIIRDERNDNFWTMHINIVNISLWDLKSNNWKANIIIRMIMDK